jgi:hypothetical protein
MQFVCKFYTFWCQKNISNDVLDDELQTDLCPFVFTDTCKKRARFRMKQVVMTISYKEMWTKTVVTGKAMATLQYRMTHPSQCHAHMDVTQNVVSKTHPPNSAF